MKQRPCQTPRRRGTVRFVLHPIGLAAMLALAGPALALPQGATVVNGQVTIATPGPTLQLITQGTPKAIVDWSSFSIGAGEKVRFVQPSSSAVLLNRVTGYDPSDILGQLQSNGRIFLLNPYGVVFGSAARVDVGGLVASSLSLSNADFLAGRYALNSNDPAAPAQRGTVRNDGTISAPGGVVVLAGPNVVNTGSIEAASGRVGLAAAQEVLVDVEGDGLILFQAKASEVGNRLAQLGRIQADGGSVELRAAARGAFADTVLNMSGTVQARGLGLRQGRVVIDGGEAGITRVAGSVDTASPDAPAGGGGIEVTGQKVLIDAGARLDASGLGAGGTVLLGGNWQGQGPLRNAEQTHVAAGAQVDVSATGNGTGGTAVVWADDTTRFYGDIAARGGAQGGDGGRIEVSGKRHLAFAGSVDARAAAGRTGALLLDPSNITIANSNVAISATAPFVGSADDSTLNVATLVAAVNAADVTVDATGGTGGATTPSISVTSAIAWNSTHSLTLKASGSIGVTAAISNSGLAGGLNLFTDGAVNVANTITLNGGAFKVAGTNGGTDRAASFSGVDIVTSSAALAGGAVAIATRGNLTVGNITSRGAFGAGVAAGGAGGAVSLSATDGTLGAGAIDTRGGDAGNATNTVVAGGAAGGVQLSIDTPTAARTLSVGTITTSGGSGSTGLNGNTAGGGGGAGGTVQISNANGGVATAGIDSRGGTGGDAANNGSPGGAGGAAHAVTVGSNTGAVSVGSISASGGAAGGGDGSTTAGARADITLSAGTDLGVTGALNAGSGTGSSTIELKFGQAGSGGTLDLAGISSIAGNTLRATGGASTTADKLVASSDAAAITLTDTNLQLTPSTAYTLAAVDAAELTGGAASNTINAASWTGTLAVRLSGGATDVVHGNGAKTTLIGNDAVSTYTISAANTGSVGNTSFDGVANISAGSLADTFVLGASGSLASIAGGTGSNTLNLSAKTTAVTIDLENRSATGVGTFSGITNLVGRDGTNGTNTTLTGSNVTQTIAISAANAGSAGGVTFSGVGNLTGGTATNTFAFGATGSLAGNLVGSGADTLDLSGRTGAQEFRLANSSATPIGGSFSGITTLIGNDLTTGSSTTLIGSNAGQAFTISGANSGSVGVFTFNGVGNLTGGSQANSFEFAAAGSLGGNLGGGAAGDTLDLHSRSGAVAVNFATGKASGIAGSFSGITTVIGNDGTTGSNTTLTGGNGGQTFTLTAANAGSAGAVGFSGVGNLAGGSGADTFTGAGGSLVGSLADGGGATTLNGTLSTGGSQTYDGTVTLGSATVLASSAGGAIRFGSTLDGAQTLAVDTGGTTTFAGAVGATTALASLSTDAGGTTLISGGSVRSTGTQTYSDAVSAGTLTLTSLAAGGHLQASNAGNDFGTLSLATTGATDTAIRDANTLALGSVTLGSGTNSFTAGTQLSRSGALTTGSAPALSVGGTAVDTSVRDFFATGAASSVLIAAGSGGTHDLTAGGVGVLPGLVVSGDLTLNAGAAISQSAALLVDRRTTVNAGANPITLNAAGNNLKGAISLNNSGANDVVLVNTGAAATQLGSIAVGSGALTITAGGPLGQTGPITQAGPGAVTIAAGANTITLTDGGNHFAGSLTLTGTTTQLVDQNALTLGTLTVGALTATSHGALNLGGGNVGGVLVATSNGGTITQGGALSVAGNATVAAGAAGIDLSNPANSWGGSVALSNSGANNVALGGNGALQLAGVSVGSGTLTLVAAGSISQNAALTQSGPGAVAISAGANPVTLNDVGNNFAGAVSLTGTTVQIVDQNALTLGTLAVGPLSATSQGALNLGSGSVGGDLVAASNGGPITQGGALAVAGNSSIAAGAGSINLSNLANSFGGTVALSNSGANNVALNDNGALQLAAVTLGSGTLALGAAGPITQTAALTQAGAGAVTIAAGANTVTLDQPGNDFAGPVSVTVSGANSVALRDANALSLGTLTLGGGALTLTANGDITQAGPISAAGASSIAAGTGNVVLNNAANDFQAAVTVSGAAIAVRDANNLSVAATPALNHSLSLVAGGALTLLGGGSIDTGSADLTLSSGTGLSTGGTLAGTNVTLVGGSGGIGLNNDLLARGNLSLQTTNAPILQFGGNLAVTGSSSVTAGAAAVSLASAGNDFSGPVSVTVSGANSVALRDANALPLGTLALGSGTLNLTAAGDITQAGPITVAGAANIAAGTGNVALNNPANDFSTVAASGAAVALSDTNALQLGPVQAGRLDLVTANGAVSQSGAATVTGATTVNAGNAPVNLTQPGNRFGSIGVTGGAVVIVDAGALVLDGINATSLSVNTAAANGAIGQSAPLQVGGTTTLDAGNGDVALTNPANDFATLTLRGGALNLVDGNDLTISSLSAAPNRAVSLVAGGTLSLPLGGIDTGTADLLLASNAGTLTTRGALAGRAVTLTGRSGIVLGGNVTTSTDQSYANAVTLATDTTLNAGAGRVTLQSAVDGGGHDLGLASGSTAADAIRIGSTIGNTARLTVSGNSTLGGNVTTSGAQSYAGALTLGSTLALDAGNAGIVLQGAVDGGGRDLRLASGNAAADALRASGPITNVAGFTAAGNTLLGGGGVASSGDQTFAGRLTLAADTTLNAGAGRIALQGAVDAGGHDLLLASSHAAADAIRTAAPVANLARFDAGGNTTLGGDVTSSGDQRYAAALTLATDTTLAAGAGRIALQGAVDAGGHRLGLSSSAVQADAIRTGAAITNAAQVSVDGRLTLGGNVASSGTQTYLGTVTLATDTTLTGSGVNLAAAVDGAQALTVNAASTSFGAAVGGTTPLTRLTTDAAGTTSIGGGVTTTGAQTYGDAIRLTAASALRGATLDFAGPVDGSFALATFAGATRFAGAVGSTDALASLAVSGPATLAGGSIATSGNQTYAGPVTLESDLTLNAFNIGFGATVDGAHALTLQSAFSQFSAAVGGAAPLASLSSSGAVGFVGLADVSTAGAQSYGGRLTLAGNSRFSASALDFRDRVEGAQDLLLQADTLSATAPITGTGTLTIAPRDAGRTLGLAGGSGALQVSQALLDGAAGFARQVIGRPDGSGAIDAGALQLRGNTLLQTGSGDIRLNGSVDGAFDLALNSGGTTRIAGPVGAVTALRSLGTDNRGGAGERTLFDTVDGSGAARVFTSGAQAYADALDVQVPLQLRGGVITAEQTGNRFAGPVSVAADSLSLRSGAGLTLGDLTLAAGGRVEADGVLQLDGALRLDGGTLSLVSNALPTSVGFTDPALQTGDTLAFGFTPLKEASASIVQNAGSTLSSGTGSLLVLRSPRGGSILLDRAGNTLLGEISAVSGTLGDDSSARFSGSEITLGFVRLASSEIHVAGAPPAAGAPDPLRAGIEADVLKLSADKLVTGPGGLLRARLPFLDSQGSQTSLPGLTLVMSPQALTLGNAFGTPSPDGYIQVRIGSALGGYLTVRPKEAGGENAVILLAGPEPRPFYDGAGKLTEVRVFYNGDTPRTPQESGALTAVTAIVEDARHARFEEAVRTENVSSRLRSGVIAEVGSGRPATVGRESIKLPQNCAVKPGSLQCE